MPGVKVHFCFYQFLTGNNFCPAILHTGLDHLFSDFTEI